MADTQAADVKKHGPCGKKVTFCYLFDSGQHHFAFHNVCSLVDTKPFLAKAIAIENFLICPILSVLLLHPCFSSRGGSETLEDVKPNVPFISLALPQAPACG